MPILFFLILALVFSAILHEYAHGWTAYRLGDNTAKDAGRLTLNPLAHLDPVGSILLPLLLIISNTGFIIAWAKPVPYNPNYLRDRERGDLKVAISGPATNFILALAFGLLARLVPLSASIKFELSRSFLTQDFNYLLAQMQGSFVTSIFVLSIIICFINLLLMVFNLVPVPPLDGSKVLSSFLPYEWKMRMLRLEPYGFFIIIFLVMFGFFSIIFPLIIWLFSIIIGLG